jgi:hypothetical protein
MLTFLFWNINRKPLSDVIATIAEGESVDIVILAECAIEESALLKALNQTDAAFHFAPDPTLESKCFAGFRAVI